VAAGLELVRAAFADAAAARGGVVASELHEVTRFAGAPPRTVREGRF